VPPLLKHSLPVIISDEKGLSVYEIVKDKQIANIQMTGSWENALSKIESGEFNAETFQKDIEAHATQITKELLETSVTIIGAKECACPKCKTGQMIFFDKVVKCSNPNCTFIIFRNKSEKQLSFNQVTELITNRKTTVIKGFKGKNGKSFDAALVFDEQYKVVFEFTQNKSALAK